MKYQRAASARFGRTGLSLLCLSMVSAASVASAQAPAFQLPADRLLPVGPILPIQPIQPIEPIFTVGSGKGCKQPTHTQCMNATYLKGKCGRWAERADASTGISPCDEAVAEEADRQASVYPEDGTGRRIPADYSDMRVRGGHALYGTLSQHRQLGARTERGGRRFDVRLRRFTRDGGEIKSCAEYVYEKNWDYNEFRYEADALGDDRMAVARLALDRGVLSTPLRSLDGALSPQLGFTPARRHKNEVVGTTVPSLTYEPSPLNPRSTPRPYRFQNSDLLPKMRRAKRTRYAGDLSWHHNMVSALRKHSNEDFERAHALGKEFKALVTERRGLGRVLSRNLTGLCGVSSDMHAGAQAIRCLRSGRADEIVRRHNAYAMDLDARIEQTLEKANDMGCLEAGPSVCDWQPRLLTAALGQEIEPKMEEDFQTCVAYTADDFAPGARVHTFDDRSWTGGTVQFNTFIDRIGALIDEYRTYLIETDDGSALGETYSDYSVIGDTTAGALISYSFGWELSDMAPGRSLCELDGSISAAFRAGTNFSPPTEENPDPAFAVRGETRANIIDFHGRVVSESDKRDLVLKHDLSVAGIDIYNNLETNIPIDFTLVNESTKVGTSDVDLRNAPNTRDSAGNGFAFHKDGKIIEIQGSAVILGFIRVNLSAGAAGEIGVNFKLKAGAARNEDCNPGDPIFMVRAGIEIEPFTGVEGFAQVSVDLAGIVGVGVRAELMLVGASLPFNAAFAIGPSERGGRINLVGQIDSDLRFKIRLLDGEVKLVVTTFLDSFLPGLPISVPLFSWEGVHVDQPIFETSERVFDLELARLAFDE